MDSKDWIELSYTDNRVIPLVGEIILLPLSPGNIDFPYGPDSHFAPSIHYSHSSTSNNSKSKAELHYVLILSVLHSQQNNNIRLSVLPILSYSSPPKNRAGSHSDWNADWWMKHQATDIQRLHHLPLPVTNWIPPSPSPDAPVLSFGGWKSVGPSWVAMVRVPHSISKDTKWFRHHDGPVILDGGTDSVMDLFAYLDIDIPSMLEENPPDYTELIDSTIADTPMAPDYYNVLRKQYRTNTNLSGDSTIRSMMRVDNESVTSVEMEHAGLDDDDDDPCSFYNLPEESKELETELGRSEKDILNERILKWREDCVAKGAGDFDVEEYDEASSETSSSLAVSEGIGVQEVDVQDIVFSERPCGGGVCMSHFYSYRYGVLVC